MEREELGRSRGDIVLKYLKEYLVQCCIEHIIFFWLIFLVLFWLSLWKCRGILVVGCFCRTQLVLWLLVRYLWLRCPGGREFDHKFILDFYNYSVTVCSWCFGCSFVIFFVDFYGHYFCWIGCRSGGVFTNWYICVYCFSILY